MGIPFIHLADTHIGARHPSRAAGDPFTRNLRRALAPARCGEVGLVLHGGDVFNRSRPPSRVLMAAATELLAAAEGGAHVVVVPGNHERGLIPARLLLAHPRVHVIEAPSRLRLRIDGMEVAIFGFPFLRGESRRRFPEALAATGWPQGRADASVLLCHQTLDGSVVGPSDYTFRGGPDVVPRSFVPAELDYAALGHIHRHQILRHPENPELSLAYPGSTERTSRAERHEEKGALRGELRGGGEVDLEFRVLESEPLPPAGISPSARAGTPRPGPPRSRSRART